MVAYVVAFGPRKARRYLGQPNTTPVIMKSGQRRIYWVRDIERAELFSSAAKAKAFALSQTGHRDWIVAISPPRGLPTGSHGGTPAAVAVA